jgi:hypothetical protein
MTFLQKFVLKSIISLTLIFILKMYALTTGIWVQIRHLNAKMLGNETFQCELYVTSFTQELICCKAWAQARKWKGAAKAGSEGGAEEKRAGGPLPSQGSTAQGGLHT